MTIAPASQDTRVAPLPRSLLDALQDAGIEPALLGRKLGLTATSLDSGLTFEEADRFLCAAWDAAADPAIGLKAGCMLKPERFGIVGIAAMSSPTFGVAVQRKARYWRLIWGDAYQVQERGAQAAVVLMPSGPPRPYTQAKIDMELASLLTFGRRFTGVPIVPLTLEMAQPTPAWRRRYEEVFGCAVRFSCAENKLVFRRADFDLPLLSVNNEVSALVAGGAEAALTRLQDQTIRLHAGAVIDRMLQDGEPTLASLARQMHMSARTLQRRLAQESLCFTDVLDERRRVAAQRHMAQPGVTAEEVTFLLGFAAPSSFFRAFKRWTGMTPDAWRRRTLA